MRAGDRKEIAEVPKGRVLDNMMRKLNRSAEKASEDGSRLRHYETEDVEGTNLVRIYLVMDE